jgi:uncharacterized membrane protein (UPF0127 family)
MIKVKVRLCSSITNRTFGQIGKKEPEALMFLTRFGIHTFGIKFPLDILVLDSNNVVVKLKKSLNPNRVFFWPLKFDKVLELPGGYIGGKNINIGSKISLEMVK